MNPASPPRPLITEEAAAFWAGLAEHRLVLPWCPTCSQYLFPPPVRCPTCLRADLEHREVPGTGKVVAHAVVMRPLVPGYPPPYVIARVELDAQPGLVVDAALHGVEPGAVSAGRRVGSDYADHVDHTTLCFRPIA